MYSSHVHSALISAQVDDLARRAEAHERAASEHRPKRDRRTRRQAARSSLRGLAARFAH